jgi:hypothetical protein
MTWVVLGYCAPVKFYLWIKLSSKIKKKGNNWHKKWGVNIKTELQKNKVWQMNGDNNNILKLLESDNDFFNPEMNSDIISITL